MRILYRFLCGFLLLSSLTQPLAARADDFDRRTPEYSGPSAAFDSELDNARSERTERRLSDQRVVDRIRAGSDDRAYDAITRQRSLQVQREMDMRRDEVRRPYDHYNE